MPSPAVLSLTLAEARRFVVDALGLIVPHAGVAEALDHHGYVQIDPINVCGRMHEHILRNRVTGYREGDLFRHLHGAPDAGTPLAPHERGGFEHYLPTTGTHVAFPVDAFPYLRRSMQKRARSPGAWSGRLDRAQQKLAAHIFERLADGPIASEDIAAELSPTHTNGWGNTRLAKSTLDKLFFHGRVLIAHRRNYRRVFDLPERVLPQSVLDAPTPSPRQVARWEVVTKLKQRRLCLLKKAEVLLVADLVQPVNIVDGPAAYMLRTDLPRLDELRRAPLPPPTPSAPGKVDSPARLLAPLDPLVYDRELTRRLWGYAYTWEVYTPPQKRTRGYYALPVFWQGNLVGHVDLKANRPARQLELISRVSPRSAAITAELARLSRFLGLRPPPARPAIRPPAPPRGPPPSPRGD